MKSRKFCYTDELNDDFAGVERKTFVVDARYDYHKTNIFYKFVEFVVYRVFVLPFAYVYMKIKFRHKVINKNVLKCVKGRACFMYGNHTLMAGDAFIPNIINAPKKTYTIVSSDNISVKLTRPFIEMCGAIPLPTTITATKNFKNIIAKRIQQKAVIQIYPEAHIWPYFTGIRPFKSGSFRYPIELDVATYCITNTFHKRKLSKNPKIITYIDGPFYANKNLTKKEQEIDLRNQVYDAMCQRAKLNTYSVNTYVKGDENS